MVRSWEARKAGCVHPGEALSLNTLPHGGCLSPTTHSPLPQGLAPAAPGVQGQLRASQALQIRPASSFLTSPVFWHMLQRVASAGSPDWGIGRCCWASYRDRQTDVQNSWKEPPEPVWATTESLVFQISLEGVGGETGSDIHSALPSPFTSSHRPPSSGTGDHGPPELLLLYSGPLPHLPGSQFCSTRCLPTRFLSQPLFPACSPPSPHLETFTYFLQKVQVFLPEGFLEKVVRQDEEQKSWGSPLRW